LINRLQKLILILITALACLTPVEAQNEIIASVSLDLPIFNMAWSSDGELLAVGSAQNVTLLTSTLEIVDELTGHSGEKVSVAWSPDSIQLATVGGKEDRTIRVWQRNILTNSFGPLIEFSVPQSQGDEQGVQSVAWSPDGSQLAALAIEYYQGYRYGTVYVWRTDTWAQQSETIDGLADIVPSLAWSPDSQTIALIMRPDCQSDSCRAVRDSQAIYFINASSGELVRSIPYVILEDFQEYFQVGWTAENYLIISGIDTAVYDGTTGESQRVLTDGIMGRFALSPDGCCLLQIIPDPARIFGTYRVYEIATGQTITDIDLSEEQFDDYASAFSWRSRSEIALAEVDGEIKLIELS
jgi:WD40 repeat protein